MAEYTVTYVRTVYETYEATINADSSEEAENIVYGSKYGNDGIFTEEVTETVTDNVEIIDVQEGE